MTSTATGQDTAPGEARGTDPGPSDREVRALVRFSGEIATKSRRTRARFQNRLAANLRDAYRSHGIPATVDPTWSRLYVSGPDERILDPLARTFGISSFSPLEAECPAELDRIVETGRAAFADRVRGRRYAVRARRSGSHDFRSSDVMRELGAALNPGATVDLDHPDVEVRVEVRDRRAMLFSERRAGPGGLPLGVQGRAVVLLSGGFDSAVAAWMTQSRGIPLDYVFCNLGGAAYRRLVLEVAMQLARKWSYGSRPDIHVLDFAGVVEAMRQRARPAYLQVVLKRQMYRAASRIGREIGADAIVTGESIGQVSSQTLANLRAIEGAADLPVLRPLVGMDKESIVARAREIGTHDLSARVREYCQVAPDRPVTAATPERAVAEDEAVGPEALERALAERSRIDLRELRTPEVVGASLFVAEVPEGARVIDTRPPEAFQAWHWPRAVHREYDELAADFAELDDSRTYVLYCAEGLRTAHLAERMQASGYEAYSFRGGARALRRHAEDGES